MSRGPGSLLSSCAFSFLILASGCGGAAHTGNGGGGGGVVSVAISPASATVSAGGTQQFQATVSGSSNTAVQWQVNGVTGGTTANGTISTSGLYTAPPTTVTISVTVTAVASADTSKTANATVTVNPLPIGTVTIAPLTAT